VSHGLNEHGPYGQQPGHCLDANVQYQAYADGNVLQSGLSTAEIQRQKQRKSHTREPPEAEEPVKQSSNTQKDLDLQTP
jgi:hypothetical protein